MKELYIEGLANHNDRESCADVSNDVREALTAAHTGWVLSPVNLLNQSADTFVVVGRQYCEHRYMREANRLCVVEDPKHVWKFFERESGEPMFDQGKKSQGPHWESERNNPMMNGHGQSDNVIVAKKFANNSGLINSTLAEQMEPSTLTEGNKRRGNTCQTQGWESVQNSLRLVHQKAKEDKKIRFTALMHHIYNIDTLRQAYCKIKRYAAPGVDNERWDDYGEELEGNLQDLSDRLKRGAYRAKPVRRAYIPKPDGRKRPLGITTLEDKIVQRATVEVLNAIYEADFVGFSYGFRPRRSQHKALDALYAGVLTRKVNWVLDADIRDYFSSISHEWLVKFIEHRIADKRVVRLIQKWIGAGVLEDGQVTYESEGAPQGGSASPLMSNVYLHYVYDLWVQQWRQRQAHRNVSSTLRQFRARV